MREIVIVSGKGGTGKTSITASLAMLAGSDAVIADCDVDAADMHLLLKPDWLQAEDFYSGVAAEINQKKCIQCGKCKSICRFNAIDNSTGQYIVSNLNCEGCGYCGHICPANAIEMIEQNVGKCYISNTKANNKMVHASLKIGADNSGKLVAKVKREAKAIAEKEQKEYIIVDGSPGIGCPVVSSLSGADFVVFVTEPTVSGIHDLERVYQLVNKFRIPSGCIINKADLNAKGTSELVTFMQDNEITHLANIPYDESFTIAMTKGQSIVEDKTSPITASIEQCWKDLKKYTGEIMKIAFTTNGIDWDSKIDPRFGRTEFVLVYNEDTDEFTHVDNRSIADEAHGAGPKTAQLLFDIKPEVLITGNGPGGNAAAVLQKTELKIYIGAGDMTVKAAYEAYKNGNLKEG